MDASVIETSTINSTNFTALPIAARENQTSVEPLSRAKDIVFELGLWLSGLESFLNIHNHSFADESRKKASERDWTKEFRLTHSTLLLCSRLTFQLGKIIKEQKSALASGNGEIDFAGEDAAEALKADEGDAVTEDDIFNLSTALKDAVLLNEGLLRAAPLRFGEWTAWSNSLSGKFKSIEAFDKVVGLAEKTGEEFLPEVLRELLNTTPLAVAVETDLRLVLPRFAKILKWLSVVERMLENDEPLKPSLLIFSSIYEQIREMMSYVNNRLLRFSDESDALFGSLDGASYAASIELRKVYNYELVGLAELRQAPLIYAKIETAFSLLNNSFQLTMINFAQLIEPGIEPQQLFPSIKIKFEQSVILRRDLWQILREVKKAEENFEEYPLDELHGQLNDFRQSSLNFLFYKDRETVERFVEEVLITNNKKDLVPTLHRFGAYLETLFGQVSMRVVLAGHPFEFSQESQ